MNSLGRYLPANFSSNIPITIDAGVPWEYIRIINNSPYLLSISFGNQGTIDFPEMFLEDIPMGSSFNGKISIVPVSNFPASSIAAALSSLISVNAYLPGEIRQPQAQPLTTLANVGNSLPLSATATAVANDGNVSGTQFIESSIGGVTHRIAQNQGYDEWLPTLAGANKILLEFFPTDGLKDWALIYRSTDSSIFFQNRTDNTSGLVLLTGTNGIAISGPVTLITGSQESGHAYWASAINNAGSLSYWVRFQKEMTNAPSSITVSNQTQTNITALSFSITGITKDGFIVSFAPNGTNWVETFDWVTVGN